MLQGTTMVQATLVRAELGRSLRVLTGLDLLPVTLGLLRPAAHMCDRVGGRSHAAQCLTSAAGMACTHARLSAQTPESSSGPPWVPPPCLHLSRLRPCRSQCATFAALALFINNARWDGVPFLLKAGKALHSRRAEIRVQFRHVPGNLYRNKMGLDLDRATNELARPRCRSS